MSGNEVVTQFQHQPQRDRAEFVQVYRSQMKALRTLTLEAPAAAAVLWILLERCNDRNALIASTRTLCQIVGRSRATVTRALTMLRDRNYIEVLKTGNTNVLVINKRVAWSTDTRLRLKLAVFDARVIVSADEQTNPDQLGQQPELKRLPPLLVPPEIATTVDDQPDTRGQTDLPID